jgi:hypothetical protein
VLDLPLSSLVVRVGAKRRRRAPGSFGTPRIRCRAQRAARATAARRSDAQLDDPEERARGYRLRNREYHLVLHRMSHSRVMADLSQRIAIRSQNSVVARATMESHIIGTVAAFSATLGDPGAG